jgi:hypothetical protein
VPTGKQLEDIRDAVAPVRRRRGALDEAELREIARTYRTAGRRNPTLRVAEVHNVSRSTASRWIRAARDHGLLEEASN